MRERPLIAIPGRFAAQTSALRFGAVVTARALGAAVLRAGGEPLTVHPWAPDDEISDSEIAQRLSWADGVLLPGGGDLDPCSYGSTRESEHVYDVDAEQDAFDLAIARWAVSAGIPLLAICRGMQVLSVAHGATLEQHMPEPHRPVRHHVTVHPGTALADIVGASPEVSCFHHQRVVSLGPDMVAVAESSDGVIEAVAFPAAAGWVTAVQWHPEDLAATDSANQRLFDELVAASRTAPR